MHWTESTTFADSHAAPEKTFWDAGRVNIARFQHILHHLFQQNGAPPNLAQTGLIAMSPAHGSVSSNSSGSHDCKSDRRDDGDHAQIRAELHAFTCRVFSCILGTLPEFRRKELAAFGEYQSKRKALEEYERFANA